MLARLATPDPDPDLDRRPNPKSNHSPSPSPDPDLNPDLNLPLPPTPNQTEPIKVGKASPTEGVLPSSVYLILKYEDDFLAAVQAQPG